jgi:hypothetical protein
MPRAMPRRQPSGSALLWGRRHREATQALAAQVADALRSPAPTDDPSPATGEGQRAGSDRLGSVGGRA